MYTLTHESTATNTVKGAEMEELLEKARSNNQNDDITGYLIYYKGRFLQLLEGDKRKIEALYIKIKKDERHNYITLSLRMKLVSGHFLTGTWPINENHDTKYEFEQFRRNLIMLSDLVEPTSETAKQFWKKIKNLISAPPL